MCLWNSLANTDENLPEVFFSPIGQFKPRGSVTISCKTQDSSYEQFEYTRNGVVIAPSLDKRISRNVDGSLVVTGLDYQKDNGDYRCILKNNRGKILSLKKRLDVKGLSFLLMWFLL